MSAVQPFRFDGADVRVVTDEHGEPWFVLADLCAVLGITNVSNVAARLADDEVRRATLRLTEGSREVERERPLVNEAGMWSVIVRSDSPAAEPVRRWVTHEVLPAIRKTGRYGAPDVTQITRSDLARMVLEAEEQLAIAAPKADAFDAFLSATGDYSVNEAAKILSRDHAILTGEKRLWAWLDANGWTYRQAGERRAYQRRIEQGVLAEKAGIPWHHPRTGEVMAGTPQVRVTPKGIDALAKALTKVADQGELEVGA